MAVKVEGKRLPVSPFSGFDLYHHFRNDAFYDLYNPLKVRETGKRRVVFRQPLPQTLYTSLSINPLPSGLDRYAHWFWVSFSVTKVADLPKLTVKARSWHYLELKIMPGSVECHSR